MWRLSTNTYGCGRLSLSLGLNAPYLPRYLGNQTEMLESRGQGQYEERKVLGTYLVIHWHKTALKGNGGYIEPY